MSRTLSYTEISTALECFAQWDFAYGGRLAGTTLKSRQTAPQLSDGRAWGAGVAVWHATGDWQEGMAAIWQSLADDARHEMGKGFTVDPERTLDQYENLCAIFGHHVDTVERLPGLTMLEGELNVPAPSRGGRRGSNRYRFHCYLDGHVELDGHPWIVEFKLRAQLTPRTIIERQPQYRWYALAYALQTGTKGPVGLILDETLKAAPAQARVVKAKRKGEGIDGQTVSHATNQITTPDRYTLACQKFGVEPEPDTLAALAQRRWHQRTSLIFTPDELREAADELRSAAKVIRDLDSGELAPIRNGKRSNCQSCRFVGICKDPTNDFLVNSLYTRTEPKRLRGPKPEGAR